MSKMFSIILALLFSSTYCIKDVFDEQLFIRQLQTGHVYSLFQFITKWNVNIFDETMPSHYNLFPKSFGEIISTFGIAELHLSLTQGRWHYNKWGYPILEAPPGVELWVWFHPDQNETIVDKKWKGLVHALSGQFCSSLNFIDKTVTVSPHLSMKPLGLWGNKVDADSHLRYATLSRETVCTENLTPWKKLLPCAGQAGLSSLLNARRLYDSSYHSLAIHLRSVLEDGEVKLELKQTISSVFDPLHAGIRHEWSLQKLFGRKLSSKCPVASSSVMLVDLNDENISETNLSPTPQKWSRMNLTSKTFKYAQYDLATIDFLSGFDVEATIEYSPKYPSPPHLLVQKYTTGYGPEMGSTCVITNTHNIETFKISYLDIIPYFVRTYFHTFHVKINNKQVKPDKFRYTPAYQRERPAKIEFILDIPPKATATISISFETVFLDWTQYPPDAHHGFYIGSSVISTVFPDRSNSSGIDATCTALSRLSSCTSGTDSSIFRRIYTEPIVILLASPDFSMPYNVICLTCTVIAIAFGSIYNLSTRTFQLEIKGEEKTWKEKIIGGFMKIFGKLFVKKSTKEGES